MPSVLLLDNYDSFTFNLFHLIRTTTGFTVKVAKNDGITVPEASQYDYIVISPGPDLPEQAGISKLLIQTYQNTIPILGVCLGHQAIGEFFGARLKQLNTVFHGEKSWVIQEKKSGPLFEKIPPKFEAGRYHSWVIDESDLPGCLQVTSRDLDGTIMSVQHVLYPVFGVQFHPESYMTSFGNQIIKNFFKTAV